MNDSNVITDLMATPPVQQEGATKAELEAIRASDFATRINHGLAERRRFQEASGAADFVLDLYNTGAIIPEGEMIMVDRDHLTPDAETEIEKFLGFLGNRAAREFHVPEDSSTLVFGVSGNELLTGITDATKRHKEVEAYMQPVLEMIERAGMLNYSKLAGNSSDLDRNSYENVVKMARKVMSPLEETWLASRGNEQQEAEVLSNIRAIVKSLKDVLPLEVINLRPGISHVIKENIRAGIEGELLNALLEFESTVKYVHKKESEGYRVDVNFADAATDLDGVDFEVELTDSEGATTHVLGQVKSSVLHEGDPLFLEADAQAFAQFVDTVKSQHPRSYSDVLRHEIAGLPIQGEELHFALRGQVQRVQSAVKDGFIRFDTSKLCAKKMREGTPLQLAVVAVPRPDEL